MVINLLRCIQPLMVQPYLKQGITGHVYLQQGNRMPMKGRIPRSIGQPVQCDVYIYAPLKLADVLHKGAIIQAEHINPLKVVHTYSTGYFSVELPEGNYSVLIKWNQLWYADRINSQDDISLIEIAKNSLVNRDFIVGAKSSY